jgi:uncharacterized protein
LKPVLLDTGVIVALFDRSERRNAECVAAINSTGAPLITCEAVIAESCYLLRDFRGAAERIMENIASGAFQIGLQLSRNAAAIRRILRQYRDRKIDFADACLIHLANELRTGEILTLDSDFEIYRWSGNRRFDPLIPYQR